MKILVNGEPVEGKESATIEDLVKRHELVPAATLVEHNGVALHRRQWAETQLQEGDRLEILRVAAGG